MISAFVGMFFGGIVYGGFVNRQDQKAGKTWDFSDLDSAQGGNANASAKSKMGAMLAMSILLVPIVLSLPNDSGFWAISRFFHLSEVDTIRGWTLGGFAAGVSILVFARVLSLFQGVLPGLLI